MKPKDLRGQSDEQLQLSLNEVLKNLFHLRVQSATDRLETPSEMRKARRDVARIRTIMRERELAKEREALVQAQQQQAAAQEQPVAG
jgi:large subunit ribosomal protein L29